ncbi:hypothetical protein AcV7_000453 [Taiwanofungus camphoratus]|nr:hypothetical protein AcV7_000453 [Antrodia cinnamomea]
MLYYWVFIGDSVALQEFVYNTCTLAASALIFYEHLITLQKEVQQFWGRNISGGLIVFLVNRYTLLAYGVIYVLNAFSWTTAIRFYLNSIKFLV